MDEKTKSALRTGGAAVTVIAVMIFIAAIYLTGLSYLTELFIILAGIGLGIIVSVHLLENIDETKTLELDEEEELLLDTSDTKGRVFVSVPDEAGGFIGKGNPVEVRLYLTNVNILAEPPNTGECILCIPLFSITNFNLEKRLTAEYIRVSYMDINGEPAEVLLFPGMDAKVWNQELSRMFTTRT